MAQITQEDRNNTIPSAVNDFLNWVTQQSPAAQNQQPQQQAPQQPANQSGPMETAFNAQQNSSLGTMATNNSVGPYQEGVLKGLRKAGEEHAYNAVSMGMDPNVMMQHPVMQGATQQVQNQNLVSTNQPQNPNPNPNSATPNNNDILQKFHDFLVGNTPSNAPNTNNPTVRREPGGVLGQFSPGSDTEQPGNAYKLLTLLAGGGGYKPQEMTGLVSNTSGIYGKRLEAAQNALSAADKQEQAALDKIGKIAPLIPQLSIQTGGAMKNPEVKKAFADYDKAHENKGKIIDSLRDIANNPPSNQGNMGNINIKSIKLIKK